jgi:hypothetical protein
MCRKLGGFGLVLCGFNLLLIKKNVELLKKKKKLGRILGLEVEYGKNIGVPCRIYTSAAKWVLI